MACGHADVEMAAAIRADWKVGVQRFEIPADARQVRTHADQKWSNRHLDT
jgi:hypothetical protein